MSSAVIEFLFRNAKCTICQKPMSAKCKCHEPKDPVTLTCMFCPNTFVIEREPFCFDFKTIETICPKCASDPKKQETYERRTGTKDTERRREGPAASLRGNDARDARQPRHGRHAKRPNRK